MCSLQEHIEREIRERQQQQEAAKSDAGNWFAEHAEGYR